MIHYLLQNHILPPADDDDDGKEKDQDNKIPKKWRNGQRNCANFLFGTCIYVVIYVRQCK